MADFKVGDRVVWRRLLPARGLFPENYDYGIPRALLGTSGIISGIYESHHVYGPQYVVRFGADRYDWVVIETMLDLETPLSPLEQSINAYIRSELRNG